MLQCGCESTSQSCSDDDDMRLAVGSVEDRGVWAVQGDSHRAKKKCVFVEKKWGNW